jgi:predicted transcriptional regulator
MEKKDKKWMLTNSEMQVMQILWSLPEQRGFASDIMQGYTDRRPALTTLLTFLKILQEKGFVVAEKEGRSHKFCALVSRDDYTATYMTDAKNTFFGGSLASLVSFFARREALSDEERAEILQLIQNGAE